MAIKVGKSMVMKVGFIVAVTWSVLLVMSLFVRNPIIDWLTYLLFLFILAWTLYLNVFGIKRGFVKSIRYAFKKELNCDICGM